MQKALYLLPLLFLLSCTVKIYRIPVPPEGVQGVLYYDGAAKEYKWIDPKDLLKEDPSPTLWDAPNPWQWVPIDTMTIYNANTNKPLFFWGKGTFYKPADPDKTDGSRQFGSKQ